MNVLKYFVLFFVLLCTNMASAENANTKQKNLSAYTIRQVKFENVPEYKLRSSQFSFLKHEIIDDENLKNDQSFSPLTLSKKLLIGPALKKPLMVISLAGSLYCSSQGCPIIVFEQQDSNNYKKIADYVSYDLHELQCKNHAYIITSGKDGYNLNEYSRISNSFQVKKYENINAIPTCKYLDNQG